MQFLLYIQDNIRTPILNDIMIFITNLGNAGIVWIAATILLLCIPKTRRVGIMSAMAMILSLIINNGILKNLVARTRPYDAVHDLTRLIGEQVDYSFPSGHTSSSFAAGTIFFRNLPKWIGIPSIILACLIAFSRLYVGVHYPSDVLFGVVSGILFAISAELIFKWLSHKYFSKM